MTNFALSKRGYEMSKDPFFVTAAMKAWSNLYHPETNPNGYINLAVAENVLMAREMCDKIDQINTEHKIQPRHLNYTDFAGDFVFRDALSHLFQRYIFDTTAKVSANDFVVFNGAGSVLEGVGAALCDSGEAILVPSPMYLALPNDFGKRFNAVVYPVPLPYNEETNEFELTAQIVQQTYLKAKEEGIAVRGFLLLNPDNPTGQICSRQTVEELMDWCESERIHFLSDEVYALSVFNSTNDNKFVSAGKIMLEKYGESGCEFCHIIYSFSKDFTLNGFRVGVLYTHNKELLTVCRSNAYFTGVSSHTQHLLSHIVTDDTFMPFFVETNAKRLKESFSQISQVLRENNIKYIEPKGGMFVFINLSESVAKWIGKHVSDLTSEDETIFWQHILDEAKVNISAGSFFLCKQAPGWFRICFTSTTADILRLGLQRIFQYIQTTKYNPSTN